MRGFLCRAAAPAAPNGPTVVWDKGRDAEFIKFIRKLGTEIGGGKILMLTVGSDVIDGSNGLNEYEYVDFFNIETHHYSLYENLRNPIPGSMVKSYPNSPLYGFDVAYQKWINAGITSEKIIMGVDFGNTFQVVSNSEITNNPSVNFIPQISENFEQDPVLQNLKKINSVCPELSLLDDKLHLYSFPWRDLSKLILDQSECNATKPNWVYNFDVLSSTPWLYRKDTYTVDNYQFISYEDYFSLSRKLSYATSKSIGEMSIFDVSYDDIYNSLLTYIRGKESVSPTSDGGTSSPVSPPTSVDNKKTKSRSGVIVGAVFGSLIGFLILAACFIMWYRQKSLFKSEDAGTPRLSKSKDRSFFLYRWYKNKKEQKEPATKGEINNYPQEILQISGERATNYQSQQTIPFTQTHNHGQETHNHGQETHNQGQETHNHGQETHNHGQETHNHGQETHNHGQETHNHGQEIRDHGQEAIPISENTGLSSVQQNIDMQNFKNEIIQAVREEFMQLNKTRNLN